MNQSPSNENKKKPLILIIEDQHAHIDFLVKILNEKEYEIAIAQDAESALEFKHGDLPDLILLDIHLELGEPNKSEGFDVCREFKSSPETKDIPIIFLTVEENEENIVKGFDLGAVDYFIKSGLSKKRELLARVETHLNLKKAKDLNKKQNDQLQELNATKDKFFSIIAHDLKNPFSPLLLDSDILVSNYDDFDDEKREVKIGRINKAAHQLFDLLENLLIWARLQRGELEPNPQMIDLSKIADANVSLYDQAAKMKNIDLSNAVDTDTTAFADENMIKGVLRNLINNGIKFTGENGKVTAYAQDLGNFVEVSVSDTGIGIADENLSKLFRIDEKFKTRGTKNEEGTGLGLILCWEFVTKNGGKIWAESKLGEGATFKFTLPKSRQDEHR